MTDTIKETKETKDTANKWPVVHIEYTEEEYISPPASPRPFPLEAANEAWIKGRQLYLEKHPENTVKATPPTDWSFLFAPK